jgi:hypothetical protein
VLPKLYCQIEGNTRNMRVERHCAPDTHFPSRNLLAPKHREIQAQIFRKDDPSVILTRNSVSFKEKLQARCITSEGGIGKRDAPE